MAAGVYDCQDPLVMASGLNAAAESLSAGGLVVIPTDTVYGIAADAFSPDAVAALLAAKGRGRELPVPVLVGAPETLDGLCLVVPEDARRLVSRFWPGGLTLVVRHSPSLAWDLGDAMGTVAVRMPDHPVALELLRRTGPLAVSSANRTGGPPATTAAAAREQLGDTVEVYLEAGPSGQAMASTIIDLTGGAPRLLRAGVLAVHEIREMLPELVA